MSLGASQKLVCGQVSSHNFYPGLHNSVYFHAKLVRLHSVGGDYGVAGYAGRNFRQGPVLN